MPRLIIPPNFKKVLRKKPEALQKAVNRCLKLLADDPRHPGLKTHKVHGVTGVFEAYVDIHNRITFERDGDTIVLRNNCNHDILDRSP